MKRNRALLFIFQAMLVAAVPLVAAHGAEAMTTTSTASPTQSADWCPDLTKTENYKINNGTLQVADHLGVIWKDYPNFNQWDGNYYPFQLSTVEVYSNLYPTNITVCRYYYNKGNNYQFLYLVVNGYVTPTGPNWGLGNFNQPTCESGSSYTIKTEKCQFFVPASLLPNSKSP